jgi:aspartate aminotransferase-like enzyme
MYRLLRIKAHEKIPFSPGPTMLPPEILTKMAEPIMHHREPEFEKIFAEIREGLRYLFQTKNEVLIFTSSGTGAMEGAVSNILATGDKAVVVRGGKFGERWGEICKAYGIEFIPIDVEWGKAVVPQKIEEISGPIIIRASMRKQRTSTGVKHREIAEIVKRFGNTVIVVDAITGIGVFDIPMDAWGLDVVVSGSQKALMLPPGLAFAAVSDKAWKFVEKSNLPGIILQERTEEHPEESKRLHARYHPVCRVTGISSNDSEGGAGGGFSAARKIGGSHPCSSEGLRPGALCS